MGDFLRDVSVVKFLIFSVVSWFSSCSKFSKLYDNSSAIEPLKQELYDLDDILRLLLLLWNSLRYSVNLLHNLFRLFSRSLSVPNVHVEKWIGLGELCLLPIIPLVLLQLWSYNLPELSNLLDESLCLDYDGVFWREPLSAATALFLKLIFDSNC